MAPKRRPSQSDSSSDGDVTPGAGRTRKRGKARPAKATVSTTFSNLYVTFTTPV